MTRRTLGRGESCFQCSSYKNKAVVWSNIFPVPKSQGLGTRLTLNPTWRASSDSEADFALWVPGQLDGGCGDGLLAGHVDRHLPVLEGESAVEF